MRPPIKVKEMPSEAEAGEALPLRRRQQGVPVMAGKSYVGRDGPVHGIRDTANMRVPQLTAMTGIDHKRLADVRPQRLQRIEETRVVPVFPATEPAYASASQLTRRKMRPAPAGSIEFGNALNQHAHKSAQCLARSD